MLNELIYKEHQLIDAWDKNLSIYPVEDYDSMSPYRHRMTDHYNNLHDEVKNIIPTLRATIDVNGPISSTDIKDSPRIDWWWAPTKAVRAALDFMFATGGEVYIHHKVNTRKYYELTSKHPSISPNTISAIQTEDDIMAHLRWRILRRIKGVGMLPCMRNSYAFIAIDHLNASRRRQIINECHSEGLLVKLMISGIEEPYYVLSEHMPLLKASIEASILDHKDEPIKASIIAPPLDNLIWDREMIREIFDFDYVWEVYKPKKERMYGYYVLPILYGSEFIGHIEAKYNRKDNVLEIVNWFFENHIDTESLNLKPLSDMVDNFRRFLGADKVKIMPRCKYKKIVGQIKRSQFTLQ